MSLPLEVALKQCERHASVMGHAMREMPQPLTVESLQQPQSELLRLVDQFVFRFIKLQDTMGTQVLRQFATKVLAEPVEDAPFIEVLHLLERQGFLTVDAWAHQRSVRNALTHEYPEDPLRQVLALTDAQRLAHQLSDWLAQMQARLNQS